MSPSDDTEVRVVLVTVPDAAVGEQLAKALVGEELAACVNRIPGVRSVYRWKGEIHDDGEELLVIKTTAAGFEALAARVTALHPYEVPEIIALSVEAGNAPYLDWVREQVRAAGEGSPGDPPE